MRIIKIKNLQVSADTYCGQTIQPSAYYQLQSEAERIQFAEDQKVDNHHSSDPQKILVNDGTDDLSYSDGKKWLEGTYAQDAKMMLEDKNNPGTFNYQTHDKNKYSNIHVRKDYSDIKGANSTKIEIKDLWVPADEKHVDITDIIIYGYLNEAGKWLTAEIEIYLGGAWKKLIGISAMGVGPFKVCHAFCGHVDTDVGDGTLARVRLNVSGNFADGNCDVKARVTGHEET